ncbi:hypothetical protein [Aeromonas salmonicida]|uniref:hypothetical protein n=1 Tax=Aeromonas salmonicida TaxID=645 RepID=UPI0024A981FB|nr:hypothetical protein [Aeromonas salmonicida]MDM5070145.1 hypothetical protein [Aeromonas salmonicida]MDM5137045.1 hypothetical protein [Aeromonas salmonicida]WHF40213.1 hypothetical protein QJ050_15740 [Aeromonas salmonicida]
MRYPYSEGDLLRTPQRYHYTPFMGEAFVYAWRVSRELASQQLPTPALPALKSTGVADAENTQALLQIMCRALRAPVAEVSDRRILDYWLPRLLKKFEVSKRLFAGYQNQEPHPPLSDSDYLAADPYLWLAECLLRAWQRQPAGYLLSGVLKLNDTLVSQIPHLDVEQGAHLAWILMIEQQSLAELSEAMGL